MTCLTPVELCLESELERIRVPFKDRHLGRETHLVYRTSRDSSSGIYVAYTVVGTSDNELRLRHVRDEALEDSIGEILINRTFFSEYVDVLFKQDGLRVDWETCETLKREAKTEQPEPTRAEVREMMRKTLEKMKDRPEPRGFSIEFEGDKVHTLIGRSTPKNYLDGIKSPVADAYTLARRVAEFIQIH